MAFSDLVTLADRAVQEHLGGVTVTYAPASGGSVEVTGLFDRNYRLADEGHAGVEQRVPAVWLVLADLPSDPSADPPTLTIAGNTYRARERQRDSNGTVMLLLHRADL